MKKDMKKLSFTLLGICAWLFMGCQGQTAHTTEDLTYNPEWQSFIEERLCDKLNELGAESGLVIVMESATGELKACVDLQRVDSSSFTEGNMREESDATLLIRMPILLSLLETGAVTDSTMVDTKAGIAIVAGDTILDHNWRVGGYGEIPMSKVLTLGSDIGLAKAVDGNVDVVNNALAAMGTGIVLDSNPDSWIGYTQSFTPMQILTLYNNIANGRIKADHVEAIKDYMLDCVENGVAKRAFSDKVKIAAVPSTTPNRNLGEDQLYKMQICGFFPYDNPQYSIIVCINKQALPISAGTMCCPLLKAVAEFILEKQL